jgi:hypothetical protein
MKIENFSFGSIRIDGTVYEDDVVIDAGAVRKRDKKPSRKFRGDYGHTPLSVEEDIPWNCSRLVIGTGVDGKLLRVKLPSNSRIAAAAALCAETECSDAALTRWIFSALAVAAVPTPA